jgi:DNA-directed RNA polymerase subunit RPC12/RpoP
MIGIEIGLLMECAGCWQPVAINAFTSHVTCLRCNRAIDLDGDQWRALLAPAIAEGPKLPEGEKKTLSGSTGGARYTLTYGRKEPRCVACQTHLPIAAAVAQARATNGWAACARCGAWRLVRTPPPELLAHAAPGVVSLLGEDPAQVQGGTTSPRAMEPVSFSCRQCGGVLKVDGSSRMVTCQYCDNTASLPDDLWNTLHPPVAAMHWYLLYDDDRARAGPPRLEAREGELAGQTFLLRGAETSIGRTTATDICLPSGTLSKNHARVFLRDGSVWVEDLHSANGTRVNGLRINAPNALRPGDTVAFGGVTLVFLGADRG